MKGVVKMAFICEKCGWPQSARTPATKEVVQIRERPNNGGSEIVKEITVCPSCKDSN